MPGHGFGFGPSSLGPGLGLVQLPPPQPPFGLRGSTSSGAVAHVSQMKESKWCSKTEGSSYCLQHHHQVE